MLEQIVEFDSNLLDELEEKRQTIETKKAEQEKKKMDLKVARAKEGQMQILMENQKMLQENYASKLTDEEKKLQEDWMRNDKNDEKKKENEDNKEMEMIKLD